MWRRTMGTTAVFNAVGARLQCTAGYPAAEIHAQQRVNLPAC